MLLVVLDTAADVNPVCQKGRHGEKKSHPLL